MPLYNRLKEYRARLGVNQQEMGRMAGGVPADHQPDRTGGLLAFGDAGTEAGEALRGHRGGHFFPMRRMENMKSKEKSG